MRASGGLFGVGASVDAVARRERRQAGGASAGAAVGGLQLTLFSDPHVYVEGVGASVEDRPAALSYRLTMRASLR